MESADPAAVPESRHTRAELGTEYVTADEDAATSEREPFTLDPALVDRGLQGHAATQNALAEFARRLGAAPRSPAPREPQYDLAWRLDHATYVAEVKEPDR